MHIYKILVFDGYNSRTVLINGYNLIEAIQNNGQIIQNQIIKVELIGSENQENYINSAI